MRADVESAMARVITSRSSCESFAGDPRGFAAALGLAGGEADLLVGMSADLACLMPSFVDKRARSLRWGQQRTLELLEDIGEEILRDFMESSSPDDRPGAELAALADFVVDRAARLVEELEHGELLADMARFEQHLSRCSLAATRPYGESGRDTAQATVQRFDPDRELRLTPSASLGRFSWDLRQTGTFSAEALAFLPRDPCDLLFFHNGTARGLRVVRPRAAAGSALRALACSDAGGTTPRLACAGVGGEVDHEALLGPFVRDRALEWA